MWKCFFFFILVENCTTLLSKELKRNLFNLFASWSGPTAKPLGASYQGNSGLGSTTNSSSGISSSISLSTSGTATSGANSSIGSICAEEEKLQFAALQASILRFSFECAASENMSYKE